MRVQHKMIMAVQFPVLDSSQLLIWGRKLDHLLTPNRDIDYNIVHRAVAICTPSKTLTLPVKGQPVKCRITQLYKFKQ